MDSQPRYFIIHAEALPEIFLKVTEAKRLLDTGEAATVNDAVRKVGISRSAFYKYKDLVRPFNDMANGRIITFQAILKNEPGALSGLLNKFAQCGANILTINQGIPAGGVAAVNIGAETSAMPMSVEDLLKEIGNLESVVRCEVLAG